jgi:hypothetical protein
MVAVLLGRARVVLVHRLGLLARVEKLCIHRAATAHVLAGVNRGRLRFHAARVRAGRYGVQAQIGPVRLVLRCLLAGPRFPQSQCKCDGGNSGFRRCRFLWEG